MRTAKPKGVIANAEARAVMERQATRWLQAMAFDREAFKNRLGEYLSGGLGEFYKAQLASKNGYVHWVAHWRTESERLIGSFGYALAHDIRGFRDRRKALNEVVGALQARDASYRRIATGQILRDFQVHRVKVPLDDADTRAFWERALEHAELVLASI